MPNPHRLTDRQAAIITAATETLVGDVHYFKGYASEVLQRPVFTHDLGSPDFWKELKEATKEDFASIQPETI